MQAYWLALLDEVDARRPLQLAAWDGKNATAVGPGPCYGNSDLVSKINDSYLGIGDRVLKVHLLLVLHSHCIAGCHHFLCNTSAFPR